MKPQTFRRFFLHLAAFLAVVSVVHPASAENSSAQLLVNQWIRQAEDGSIQGKIVLPQEDGSAIAVSPAVVALADSQGDALVEKVNENGEFKFADVEPGVYTVLTRGAKDVCAIVAVHVLAHDDEKAAALASSIAVSAGRVDFTAVKSNLIRYLPPQNDDAYHDSTASVDFSMMPDQMVGNGIRRIKQSDGGMVGQIYAAGVMGTSFSPSQDTNIFLYQNGIEVERLTTDDSGRFEFALLEPGVYSLMAIGSSGAGLVGFELVGENSKSFASKSADETFISTFQEPIATQFVLQVGGSLGGSGGLLGLAGLSGQIAPEIISDELISEEVIGEEIVDAGFGSPMGGGYAGGGGFGGGGGGIGGGGGLLGLAAVGGAVAAAVAASSDSDRVVIPPIATPAIP